MEAFVYCRLFRVAKKGQKRFGVQQELLYNLV
jgi:hypothetical protein